MFSLLCAPVKQQLLYFFSLHADIWRNNCLFNALPAKQHYEHSAALVCILVCQPRSETKPKGMAINNRDQWGKLWWCSRHLQNKFASQKIITTNRAPDLQEYFVLSTSNRYHQKPFFPNASNLSGTILEERWPAFIHFLSQRYAIRSCFTVALGVEKKLHVGTPCPVVY